MKSEITDHLISAFGLEEADLKDIYQSYVETFRDELAKIPNLISEENYSEIKRAAHTIKGCALNCGDSKTAQIALEFQNIAQDGNPDLCLKMTDELKKLFAEL